VILKTTSFFVDIVHRTDSNGEISTCAEARASRLTDSPLGKWVTAWELLEKALQLPLLEQARLLKMET
jgi:hypothetical protein